MLFILIFSLNLNAQMLPVSHDEQQAQEIEKLKSSIREDEIKKAQIRRADLLRKAEYEKRQMQEDASSVNN